eukprot:13691457-Alexandrium_andersonii.AAC.1
MVCVLPAVRWSNCRVPLSPTLDTILFKPRGAQFMASATLFTGGVSSPNIAMKEADPDPRRRTGEVGRGSRGKTAPDFQI